MSTRTPTLADGLRVIAFLADELADDHRFHLYAGHPGLNIAIREGSHSAETALADAIEATFRWVRAFAPNAVIDWRDDGSARVEIPGIDLFGVAIYHSTGITVSKALVDAPEVDR
jgi:hypothetical protein